jgi:amino acid transporter
MAAQIKNKTGNLGTFSGVFTPSILTILGIILFLRMGYVVGNAGLGKTFIIIAIANLISVLTSFSLAAIATNMKVKGGGDYYLISRTLGFAFGGAIGIVLFLAQSISIGFYCIGFGEALAGILTAYGFVFYPQLIALTALTFLFLLAWIGADLATKFQYIVMIFLILALISFYAGGLQKWDSQLLMQNWGGDSNPVNFWILFAIFFPAVTGFTQGVSMSGDLKNAGKSLPLGTFLAVGVSILVYFSVSIIFAASNSLEVLAGNYGAMSKTAAFGFLIDAGVIAATLSSAMASFLGAPRILQSLAHDKIFSMLKPFAKVEGSTGNPRRGVLFSFAIAITTIGLGQLDMIARVVSMFFLISYGLLNYATYFEAATLSPSFRPRFKWYNKKLSLAGFMTCLAVMLAIDLKTGIAATAILFAIYQYLKRTSVPNRWADSQRSFHLQKVRDNLIHANKGIEHPREWRPYILILSNDQSHRNPMLNFANLIQGGSGITSAVKIIRNSGINMGRKKEKAIRELKKEIMENSHHAFPMVLSTINVEAGLPALLQSYGIGPIKANTVLLNWEEKNNDENDYNNSPSYQNYIQVAVQSGCNVLLLCPDNSRENVESREDIQKTIDVWWQNDDTSRLMLLLSYLISRNKEWGSVKIRLLATNYDQDNKNSMDNIHGMLEEIRIDADPVIVSQPDADEIIHYSKEADLVFLPIKLNNNIPLIFTNDPVDSVVSSLKACVLSISAQKIKLDAEPEDGKVKELAAIYDQFQLAEKKVELAKKYAVRVAKEAKDKMTNLKFSEDSDNYSLQQKIKEALETREKAIAANKRASREQEKLLKAEEEVKAQGLSTE